jgi:multiple sugar transport system permease protein
VSTQAAPVEASFVRRRPPVAIRRKRFLTAVATHSLLIAAAVIFLLPFIFIVLTSLMTSHQALSSRLWPEPFAC